MADVMPVFGIDLGTTNSCIARVAEETGRVEVLVNLETKLTTPSVVYFDSASHFIVGAEAKRHAIAEPNLVCANIKRQMGRPLETPLRYHGEEYTPEAVSAFILRKVIGDVLEAAERPRDEKVKAVITVPAYFNAEENHATMQAAILANVELLYLAHEPVAAALAYGFGRVNRPQNVLVYDLGGGTFDATVVWSDGSSARTIATDGERLCGGNDWDEEIVKWVRRRFQEEHPGTALPVDDPVLNQTLFDQVESAKQSLSQRPKTVIPVHYQGKSIAPELTLEEFEKTTTHWLEKTLAKTKAVMEEAKAKGVERIDKLLLVGGSSRMLAVKRRLQKDFGMEPVLHDPDLAIAKGAALLADLIAKGKFKPDLTGKQVESQEGRLVTTVNSKSLGLQVFSPKRGQDIVDYLIPRNSELPASVTKVYATYEENQKQIDLRVFEEREEPSDNPDENSPLHKTPVELPPGLGKGSPIEVTFKVDGVRIVHIFLKEPRSERTWEVKVERYKEATNEEVLRLKPKLAQVE